jgi:hypothetical protein
VLAWGWWAACGLGWAGLDWTGLTWVKGLGQSPWRRSESDLAEIYRIWWGGVVIRCNLILKRPTSQLVSSIQEWAVVNGPRLRHGDMRRSLGEVPSTVLLYTCSVRKVAEKVQSPLPLSSDTKEFQMMGSWIAS